MAGKEGRPDEIRQKRLNTGRGGGGRRAKGRAEAGGSEAFYGEGEIGGRVRLVAEGEVPPLGMERSESCPEHHIAEQHTVLPLLIAYTIIIGVRNFAKEIKSATHVCLMS